GSVDDALRGASRRGRGAAQVAHSPEGTCQDPGTAFVQTRHGRRRPMKHAHAIALSVVAAAVLVAAGFYAGRYTGGDGAGHASASSPASAASAERKVLYWQDPMVPGAKFDKPGKSPFMDMPLVPVYADEAGDSG